MLKNLIYTHFINGALEYHESKSNVNKIIRWREIPTAFIVRLKFQKRSVLKFVSRTIPRSGG